ncbi:MAG: hypothetical protein M3Y72_10520 [Acidobacteriota bacterium]|nr:hypothetical protein [Acidobacteriota bacterium]
MVFLLVLALFHPYKIAASSRYEPPSLSNALFAMSGELFVNCDLVEADLRFNQAVGFLRRLGLLGDGLLLRMALVCCWSAS